MFSKALGRVFAAGRAATGSGWNFPGIRDGAAQVGGLAMIAVPADAPASRLGEQDRMPPGKAAIPTGAATNRAQDGAFPLARTEKPLLAAAPAARNIGLTMTPASNGALYGWLRFVAAPVPISLARPLFCGHVAVQRRHSH
jgi:hypothetical protein